LSRLKDAKKIVFNFLGPSFFLYRIVEKLIDDNIETFEKLGMTPGRRLVFIVNLCNYKLAYLDEGDKNYLIHRLRLQFPAEKRRRKKKKRIF
jgi:hypothetical protein